MVSSFASAPKSGVYYFSQGWKLVREPGIKRYVVLPLLVNILLMGGAFWWLFTRLDVWIPTMLSHVPEWLQWLSYLVWPLAVISLLLIFGYFFSTIANWIAAPFNGLLAEQLEARLTGATPPDTGVLGPAKRRAAHHEKRMAKTRLVPAARDCAADFVFYSRYRPDGCSGAVVFV